MEIPACNRSTPLFDPSTGRFCTPRPPNRLISVMHLAGTSKQIEYQVQCTDGTRLIKKLLFSSLRLGVAVEAGRV